MSVLFIALPVALLVALLFVIAFVYQVRSGQLDDLETPQRRMLYDDVQSSTAPAQEASKDDDRPRPSDRCTDGQQSS